MVCFPNTYVHTLNKKKFFFFASPLSKKIKGGGRWPSGGKRTFLGRQKFLADGVAGKSKNWPSANFAHIVPSTSRNLDSNQKQKSYVNSKLCNAEKSKIPLVVNVQIRQGSPEMIWHWRNFEQTHSCQFLSLYSTWGMKKYFQNPNFSFLSNFVTL